MATTRSRLPIEGRIGFVLPIDRDEPPPAMIGLERGGGSHRCFRAAAVGPERLDSAKASTVQAPMFPPGVQIEISFLAVAAAVVSGSEVARAFPFARRLRYNGK